MDATVISFDDWEQVLKTVVPPDRQRPYREAIVKFKYWIRETEKPACAEVFKEHLDWKQSCLAPELFVIHREMTGTKHATKPT